MLAYYLIISVIALLFFLLLNRLRRSFFGLSLKLISMQVCWVYLVSSFLPGLIGLVSPAPALLGAFILILLGSYFIFMVSGETGKLPVAELAEPAGTETECALPGILISPVCDVALQVSMPVAVAFMPPKKILILPKDFMYYLTWREVQLLLPAKTVKIQNEEAALLPEKNFAFRKLIRDAFQAKDANNFPLARNFLKAALSQTTDISIKGMIYTELVFIYKEMGKYLEVADLIEEFLQENGSLLSSPLQLHFEKVVQYLHTLDKSLKKAEHVDLPFSKVPPLIKIRAEKIFQNRI